MTNIDIVIWQHTRNLHFKSGIFLHKEKNVVHLFKLLLCEHKVWYVYLAIVQMNLWHSIYHDVVEYTKLIFSHKLRSRSISHLVLSHDIVSLFAYDVYKHLNIYTLYFTKVWHEFATTLKQFEYYGVEINIYCNVINVFA